MSFTAADLETTMRWAAAQRPRHVPELALLTSIGLRLAVPRRTRNDLIGLLLLSECPTNFYGEAEKKLVGVAPNNLL
jgi:hypothetical protein